MLQTDYSSWGSNYRQELLDFTDYVNSLNNDDNDDNDDNNDNDNDNDDSIIDSNAIINDMITSGNDTIIFAIGPLTNIAHIIDSNSNSNVKKIVIMGGGIGLFNAPGLHIIIINIIVIVIIIINI